MTKNELAIALTKFRMARLAESQGHSPDQAKAIAENAILQGGINGIKAMATWEGSIVTIVESYLQYIAKRCVELGGADHFAQANDEGLAAIEAHRSSFGAKGLSSYPKDIDDYVFYRINLEIRDQFGCDAEKMGLDKQTTKMLTHTAKANLLKMMQGYPQQQNGSKFCFIATACFGSPDTSAVVTLRRYREAVLKKSMIGRHVVYWYYKLSPPIARYLDKHDRVRTAVRGGLTNLAERLVTKHGL